jgi:hypothetical protein
MRASDSFVPEFVSMNFMMAGMAPVMSFLMMGRDMRAMEPTELLFWGVMSIGVIAGFALAYPSNVWMVARQLKHGLMTERMPAWEAAAVLWRMSIPNFNCNSGLMRKSGAITAVTIDADTGLIKGTKT